MTPLTTVRTAQLLKMSWARISSGEGRRRGGSGSLLDAIGADKKLAQSGEGMEQWTTRSRGRQQAWSDRKPRRAQAMARANVTMGFKILGLGFGCSACATRSLVPTQHNLLLSIYLLHFLYFYPSRIILYLQWVD